MKRGAPTWVLVQAVGVAAAVFIGAAGAWFRVNAPVSQQTLRNAVMKLRSRANETAVLLDERHLGLAKDDFVREHARQLGNLVEAEVEGLVGKTVSPFLADDKESTVTQGRALRSLLEHADLEATMDAKRIAQALADIDATLPPHP